MKGKPVVLNFWGTWCPPCRAEMPILQEIYTKYKGEVEFVGISMGPRDSGEGVVDFIKDAGYSWTFAHDDTYQVATDYQVSAVPSSYFIDASGVIRAVHVGAMTEQQIEAYLQKIR
jgi:thiol-disulfide isomerase/thioredoxin